MPPEPEPRTAVALLSEGRAAFRTADYARSERLFRAALEEGADESDCRQHLARIYNLLNDWPEALQQWLWLREHAKGQLRVEAQLQVARGYFRLRNYEAAAAKFTEVLASAPDHAEARQRLNQISAMPLEINASALSTVEEPKAESGPPPVDETTRLVNDGRAAFRAQDLDTSERLFIEALGTGADGQVCRLHLARIYNSRSDWANALAQWRWLNEQDPGALEPQLQVARALFRLKRYEEATVAFKSVLELSPDHAEALRRLREIEALRDDPLPHAPSAVVPSAIEAQQAASDVSPAPSIPVAPLPPPMAEPAETERPTLVDEAKAAFADENLEYSKALFTRAIEQGADEAVCRLHLARICNVQEEWEQALDQWKWLRDRDRSRLEPHLQIGRAQLNLGYYAEAAEAFETVLAVAPDHAEAKDRLQQARALGKQSEAGDLAPGESWLSRVPESLRWQLAKDALQIGTATVETTIDLAVGHVESLNRLIRAFGDANGEAISHRQLYALQAAGQVEQARRELKKVRALVRALDRRTRKMIRLLDRDGASTSGFDGPVPPRPPWRHGCIEAAVETFQAHGFEAAVLSLVRTCPPGQRAATLAGLAEALQELDGSAALRAGWLSFGANPSRPVAERLSLEMCRSGGPAGSSALANAGPTVTASSRLK